MRASLAHRTLLTAPTARFPVFFVSLETRGGCLTHAGGADALHAGEVHDDEICMTMDACMCAQGILWLLRGVWLCSTSPFQCSVIGWSYSTLRID